MHRRHLAVAGHLALPVAYALPPDLALEGNALLRQPRAEGVREKQTRVGARDPLERTALRAGPADYEIERGLRTIDGGPVPAARLAAVRHFDKRCGRIHAPVNRFAVFLVRPDRDFHAGIVKVQRSDRRSKVALDVRLVPVRMEPLVVEDRLVDDQIALDGAQPLSLELPGPFVEHRGDGSPFVLAQFRIAQRGVAITHDDQVRPSGSQHRSKLEVRPQSVDGRRQRKHLRVAGRHHRRVGIRFEDTLPAVQIHHVRAAGGTGLGEIAQHGLQLACKRPCVTSRLRRTRCCRRR